jgi:hypothetical protein
MDDRFDDEGDDMYNIYPRMIDEIINEIRNDKNVNYKYSIKHK